MYSGVLLPRRRLKLPIRLTKPINCPRGVHRIRNKMPIADWGACDISTCSVQLSIFKYRPSLAANSVFIALFGLSLVLHGLQGARYHERTFAILMMLGCACEMIGYGGRIIMYYDPWSFSGFIMQIGQFQACVPIKLCAYN